MPQMPFSEFLVALEKLATKKAFKERISAMQQDGMLFSSDPFEDSAQLEAEPPAAAAEDGEDKQQDDEVIVLREQVHGHKDDDDDEFDPSTIDPNDLEPAQTTTTTAKAPNQAAHDDDEFDPSTIDPNDLEPAPSSSTR